MKKLLLVLAVAAVAAPIASAGGWATVGLSSLPPSGLKAKQAWPLDITVLQHGQTPLGGLSPVVTITEDGGAETFTATETSEVGVYEASVVFPEDGDWRIVIDSGFGESTVTYGPVTIGSAPGDEPSSFPALPVGIAIVAGLALLAAATFGVLRQRRLTPAS